MGPITSERVDLHDCVRSEIWVVVADQLHRFTLSYDASEGSFTLFEETALREHGAFDSREAAIQYLRAL